MPRKVWVVWFWKEPKRKSCPMWWHSFYAYLSGCMFNDPVGMAIYAELHYMMSSLMLGEWFE